MDDEHKIKLSHAILGMLGLVLTFVMALVTLAWKASATLQQIEDSQVEMSQEIKQEQNDMSAVKSLLWAPTIPSRQKGH